jgi:hypothetical protein
MIKAIRKFHMHPPVGVQGPQSGWFKAFVDTRGHNFRHLFHNIFGLSVCIRHLANAEDAFQSVV